MATTTEQNFNIELRGKMNKEFLSRDYRLDLTKNNSRMNQTEWSLEDSLQSLYFFCGSITFCFIDIICSPSIRQKDQNLYFIVAQVVKQK
jgi:hypothetical protein